MTIPLSNIITLSPMSDYKIHFAVNNGDEEPLDVFLRGAEAWKGWQEWRGRDRFSRTYIFTLIDYYPRTGTLLFGGIFEVIGRHKDTYTVKLCAEHEEYIGRLLVTYRGEVGMQRYRYLEKCYHLLTVDQILKSAYQGEPFPGYENVTVDFQKLSAIISQENTAWKTALENVKGVYLITDKSNGKKYVGAAFSGSGIWSRWGTYIETGHAGNKRLVELGGADYAKEHFQLSVLEHMPLSADESTIRDREQYWKKVLKSVEFGYNEK